MGKFYASKQSDWQEEKEEHKTVMEGLDILGEIDSELEKAFEELSTDRYGLMSSQYYDSVQSQIKQCKSDNQDQYDYVNKIHGKLEDIENDFKKNISKAFEALSLIDINSYEIENTLDITKLQNYIDYSEQGGSYGATTGVLKTRQVRKEKITFADVQAKTNMIDLREQWAQYLSVAELDKKRKLTPTEIEKLKNECYKEKLKTSFDHKVYNDGWWNTASTTLDFIPVVGGIKGFIEGCVGKTMSGEKLTANERIQYGLMGVVSIGLDAFTLGTTTAAIQGTKAGFKLANAFSKVILTDVAVGWGTKFTSEAMLNIGMSPQLVFAIHIGTNLVVAKHNTTNVKKLKDIEKTLGLKPDQVQDLMKHTGKNLDDFAKAVKNGELDSLLGIPEMNMKYLMKQTGKNADEITDWLKRNDIDLKDIKAKNVDDIIKGVSGAGGLKELSKPSSKALRQNLIDAGVEVPDYPNAAHHIVAGSSPKASEARTILQKYGVDINDAGNGIFLPTAKDASSSAYHPSIHTNAYYDEVNKLLSTATSKEDVLDILDFIGSELKNGTFKK